MKLSIRTKLLGGFALVILMTFIVAWRGLDGMSAIKSIFDSVQTGQFQPTLITSRMNVNLLAWNRAILNHIIEPDDADMDDFHTSADKRFTGIRNELATLLDTPTLSPQGRQHLNTIEQELQSCEPLYQQILDYSQNNRDQEALQVLRTKLRPRINRMDAEMDAFIDLQSQQLADSLQAAETRFAAGRSRILLIAALALVGSGVFATLLAGGIVSGININVRIARRVAQGVVDIEVPNTAKTDEIGDLARSFEQMIAAFKENARAAEQIAAQDLTAEFRPRSDQDVLGQAFKTMLDNLRRQVGELREGVSTLVTSAQQISSAATELNVSVSETAAAVNETTTTVEEVKQTALLASEKSQVVSETAGKTQAMSQTGREATAKAVQGMHEIREQVLAVTETIVKLSEQSQAIGEIIASVDDMAEQSNLLAVNASIEAVRAGEHGRGFGVVAQEMKSLAEQSKQSTAQVRTILNDIQKAITSAVMAAEQSTRSVEAGVSRVHEAGQVIETMAANSTASAEAGIQISVSSQQQLVGMDQISAAVNDIQGAANQNMESTTQLNAAAHNLSELGQTLQTLVRKYRV